MHEPLDNPAAVPSGYMMDAAGRLVPLALVKPEHLEEDALVRAIVEKAERVSAVLAAFKEQAFADIGALMELLAQKHGSAKGGAKGNLMLHSFDGSLRVQVAIGNRVDLGPELQVAKDLVDNCLRRWSVGADVKIRALVDRAFDVGVEGKLRVDRILELRRMEIQDEEWQRAMVAISEAVRVVSSKRYVRVYRRAGREGPHAPVPLDLATV